jgi:hypothetical protein
VYGHIGKEYPPMAYGLNSKLPADQSMASHMTMAIVLNSIIIIIIIISSLL